MKLKYIPVIITCLLFRFDVFAQQIEFDNRNGIYFEIAPDTTNPYRFTEDNVIYKGGNKYYFSYQYIDPVGKCFYYHYTDTFTWEFIPEKDVSPSTIMNIQLTVLPDLGTRIFSLLLSF